MRERDDRVLDEDLFDLAPLAHAREHDARGRADERFLRGLELLEALRVRGQRDVREIVLAHERVAEHSLVRAELALALLPLLRHLSDATLERRFVFGGGVDPGAQREAHAVRVHQAAMLLGSVDVPEQILFIVLVRLDVEHVQEQLSGTV